MSFFDVCLAVSRLSGRFVYRFIGFLVRCVKRTLETTHRQKLEYEDIAVRFALIFCAPEGAAARRHREYDSRVQHG